MERWTGWHGALVERDRGRSSPMASTLSPPSHPHRSNHPLSSPEEPRISTLPSSSSSSSSSVSGQRRRFRVGVVLAWEQKMEAQRSKPRQQGEPFLTGSWSAPTFPPLHSRFPPSSTRFSDVVERSMLALT